MTVVILCLCTAYYASRQRLQPTVLQRLYRAFRTPEAQCDFLDRQIRYEPQVDHLPLVVG